MLNKIKQFVFAIIILIAFPKSLQAQKFEIGAGIGASIFQGDLGGTFNNGAYKTWDLDLNSMRGMAQIMSKYTIVPNFKIRANIAYARISGNDRFAVNPDIYNRGIQMNGNVFQGTMMLEFGLVSNHLIYGILGIGYAGYDVITLIKGVDQNTPFNSSISIPVGIGVKIADVGRGILELEAVAHYLNSDVVDGYDGPNSYSNDTYSFMTLNYNIPIGKNQPNNRMKRHKNLIGYYENQCPEF
jgi:hypothetical protein